MVDFMKEYYEKQELERVQAKRSLLNWLKDDPTQIKFLVAEYDGSGDSGGIQDSYALVVATDKNAVTKTPGLSCDWIPEQGLSKAELPRDEAFQRFAYSIMAGHADFNNEGSFGHAIYDVEKDRWKLEHFNYIQESEYNPLEG